MKFNAKYDRYVTKGGLVYRYDKKKDRLIQCKLTTDRGGYLSVKVSKPNVRNVLVHRVVYETFVGEIQSGYQIDHINTARDDNRVENLRCVTPKENMNNTLTKKHFSEAMKGKTTSEFGRKFKEHFGLTESDNVKHYIKEYKWYRRHNKVCRWEVEDKCKL